jgi:hypothetical protein
VAFATTEDLVLSELFEVLQSLFQANLEFLRSLVQLLALRFGGVCPSSFRCEFLLGVLV